MSNCCRKVWTDGSINNGKGDDSMIESYQGVVIYSRRCFSNKVSFFSTSMKLHFRFLVGFTDGRKRIHNSEVPPKIESFWRLRITSFQKCRHWRARHTVSLIKSFYAKHILSCSLQPKQMQSFKSSHLFMLYVKNIL